MLSLLILSIIVNITLLAVIFFYFNPLVNSLQQDRSNLTTDVYNANKNNSNLNKDYEIILKQAKAMEEKLAEFKKVTKRKGK